MEDGDTTNTVRDVHGPVIQSGRIDRVVLPSSRRPVDWPAARGLSNLPPRNPDFIGRDELLEALTADRVAAACGLGGVGKSQLALEYAHRGEYAVRWWVRAADENTLAVDLAALAEALGVEASSEHLVAVLIAELAKHDDWLLVFDNAAGPEVLSRFVPAGGRVVITTRRRHWGGLARTLDVAEMTNDEAVRFLGGDAGELAELLGRLPLALAQARAYTEIHGCSLTRYLDLYRRASERLLRIGPKPVGYPETVATTWLLHFQAMSPAAVALLRFTAFLAPDSIPLDLLLDAGEPLPAVLREATTDPLARETVVGEVVATSLLTRINDSTVRVHRLVQEVTRTGLTAKDNAIWLTAAAEVLERLMPHDPRIAENWPLLSRLAPHSRSVGLQVAPTQRMAPTAGVLLVVTATLLNTQNEPAAALKLYEQALPRLDQPGNTGLLARAQVLYHVGFAHIHLRNTKTALTAFNQALALATQVLGQMNPQLVPILIGLAQGLVQAGDYEDAVARLEFALAIKQATNRTPDRELAMVLHIMGHAARLVRKHDEALDFYSRATAILTDLLGPDHSDVCGHNINYAIAAVDGGRPELARSLVTHALPILREMMGPEHPTVEKAGMILAKVQP